MERAPSSSASAAHGGAVCHFSPDFSLRPVLTPSAWAGANSSRRLSGSNALALAATQNVCLHPLGPVAVTVVVVAAAALVVDAAAAALVVVVGTGEGAAAGCLLVALLS